MTYHQWHLEFARRHRSVVERLSGRGIDEIVDYFDYESMRNNEEKFCPLYAEGKRCHAIENLNCYLCACPHFRYCDEGIDEIGGKIRYSLCAIDAKEGRRYETDMAIHQDCSACTLPHSRAFVRARFSPNWSEIMAECEVCADRGRV